MSYFNLKSAYDDTIFRVDIAKWSGARDGVRLTDFVGGTDIVALIAKDVAAKKPDGGSITYYAEVLTGYTDGPTVSYSTTNQTFRVQGDSHVHTKVITTALQYMIATPPDRADVPGYCGAASAPDQYKGVWTTAIGSSWLGALWSNIVVHDGAGGGGGGAGGDTSTSGGGGGDMSQKTETVTPPDFTSNVFPGVTASGSIGVFCPTQAQLQKFSEFLWSTNVFDQLAKIKDPLDYVIKLGVLPCDVPNAGLSTFSIGNIASSSEFTMYRASGQFITFDFGEIAVKEFWGNALDYSPFTKIQIFLPFIGFQTLETDDVMGATIALKYNIDIVTGGCVALVTVKRDDLNSVLYQYNGQCMMQIPVTGRATQIDFSALVSAMPAIANPSATMSTLAQGGREAMQTAQSLGNIFGGSVGKPSVTRSGNISGNTGFGAVLYPYLVINRPIQQLPEGYQTQDGYPSNITATLGDLSGYTKVARIHLEGLTATDDELQELEDMLTTGVIL